MMNITSKVVLFRRRTCLFHLFISTFLYCVVIVLGLSHSFSLMEVYGYYSVVIFAMLLISELRLPGLNILMIFLFGAFLRLSIPTIQMANDAMEGMQFMFRENYTGYIFPCAIAMNIYYMLFMLCVTRFAKDKSLLLNMSVLFSIKHISAFVLGIYILGFLVRLIPPYISFADTLRKIVSLFPTLALLIQAFYSAYSNNKSSYRIFIFLIIIELLYSILFGFYKGAIMMPLALFMIYYYLNCRNTGKKLLNIRTVLYAIGVVAFLIYFVYPFMEIKRSDAQWDPATDITYSDYDSFEIASKVISGEATSSTTDSEVAQEAATSRQNAIFFNAYFYMCAEKYGYQLRILMAALRLPIPRWLGGNPKVDDNQGFLADAWVEKGNFYVSPYGVHNAIYVGLFASAYFWGGWPAAILMCVFNAWVIVTLLSFIYKNSKNVFALLILFQLLTSSLNCFEEIHDGGLNQAINWGLLVVFALFFKIISRINLRRKEKYDKQVVI